jgi:glyoxylase-like metal-dependent hydrolase (beta-lactamase superfamily II)
MSDAPLIKQLELGPMQNFVYLIGDRLTRQCVVVDPAWEIDAIVDEAAADDMEITGALVTHTHQDHVGGHLFGHDIPGVAELLGKAKAKVYVHKAEREFLRGMSSDVTKVEGGDTIQVGRFPLTFIHTPGHTPGSQCFLVDGRLVSGDTLFLDGCGRTDLPGSDAEAMYDSLQRLAALPDGTVVFPGHRYSIPSSATMASIREQNYVFEPSSKDQWLTMFGR